MCLLCENCEQELDECNCVECNNCLSLEAYDNLDRNGYCLECQGWRCETCNLDLEDCDCDD